VSYCAPATFAAAPGFGDDTPGADIVAGTVVTVTAAEAEEAAEVPAALVAVTVNVGVAVEAIPVTIIGEDAPVAV
jgi:hypothetical protein